MEKKSNILITGAAGFIGYHLSLKLLKLGHNVFGLDNLNDYYAVTLIEERLKELKEYPNFFFVKEDISNKENILELFSEISPSIVINLAAQAGVRYSLENPDAYIESNIIGFFNILEACRKYPVDHL